LLHQPTGFGERFLITHQEGLEPSTGAFVHEGIEAIRHGKHGARSRQQAFARGTANRS
jgi:hypothetical protein